MQAHPTHLVEELGGEADAELGRRDGQAPLAPAALGVEVLDGRKPGLMHGHRRAQRSHAHEQGMYGVDRGLQGPQAGPNGGFASSKS